MSTSIGNEDPRAYRVTTQPRSTPNRTTYPARRPYFTVEEAHRAVARESAGGVYAWPVGPIYDDRTPDQRRRDDLLAAVKAFIDQVDRSDFTDEHGHRLAGDRRVMELRELVQ